MNIGGAKRLIRFNVKNFLSFFENESGQSEEFSMIAGKVRSKREHIYDNDKIKLLKFAAVYGANASGKSNLVKALNFMKKTIVDGLPKGHTDMYCKTDRANKEKKSYFELEIMLDDKYYAYGFEVILSQSKFVSEWLVELKSDGSEKNIFTRDIENGETEFSSELKRDKKSYEKLKNYAEDIQEDSEVLLLSIMNKNKKTLYEKYNNLKVFRNVYMWIERKLDINYPDRPISDYSYMAKTEKIDEVCKIIKAFGTGITGFQMVDVDPEEIFRMIPNRIKEEILKDVENKKVTVNRMKLKEIGIVMRSNKDFFILNIASNGKVEGKTIKFLHGEENILFNLSEESDGTVRILDLIEVLLSGANKTYVIDELDRCLHPSLTCKFVETYLQLAAERNIQLIVTTHESRLLDFDILRRDEVWFVNKRITGESDIYSLEEYNTRFDQKIDKAYLDGRYGGVPKFSTVFPVKGDE